MKNSNELKIPAQYLLASVKIITWITFLVLGFVWAKTTVYNFCLGKENIMYFESPCQCIVNMFCN